MDGQYIHGFLRYSSFPTVCLGSGNILYLINYYLCLPPSFQNDGFLFCFVAVAVVVVAVVDKMVALIGGPALWLALALTSLVSGLGQERIVSINATTPGAFQIAGGPVSKGQILVSDNDYWGVIRAAGDLAVDFGRVTGINYTLSNGKASSAPVSYSYRPINNMNNTFVSPLFSSSGRVGS